MTALEIVKMLYPSFGSSENVENYITLSEQQTSSNYFIDDYTLAVALKACHNYYMATEIGGQAGAITHETSGTRSRTYNITGDSDDYYSSSSYGQQFLDLRQVHSQGGLGTSFYVNDIL